MRIYLSRINLKLQSSIAFLKSDNPYTINFIRAFCRKRILLKVLRNSNYCRRQFRKFLGLIFVIENRIRRHNQYANNNNLYFLGKNSYYPVLVLQVHALLLIIIIFRLAQSFLFFSNFQEF